MVKSLVAKTLAKWRDEPAPRFAAALAFYTAFTIVPFVVLVIMVSATVIGENLLQGGLHEHVGDLIGEPSADGLFHMIEQWQSAESPLIKELVALGVFLFGAIHVMDQLKDALDHLWGIKPKRPPGIVARLRQRLTSTSSLLGIAFLLLASLTMSALLNIAVEVTVKSMGGPTWLWETIDVVLSFIIITILFALIYKWVPQAKVAWSDVWIGAGMTGALYMLGSIYIVIKLGQSPIATFYGGAGSLVLVLLWAYYASQIFLFGAALIAVYANEYGSLVRPDDGAVAVHAASQGESSSD